MSDSGITTTAGQAPQSNQGQTTPYPSPPPPPPQSQEQVLYHPHPPPYSFPTYYSYPPPPPSYIYIQQQPQQVQTSNSSRKKKKLFWWLLCFCCCIAIILICALLYFLIRALMKNDGPCEDFHSYACKTWYVNKYGGVMETGQANIQLEVTEAILHSLEANETDFVHSTTNTMFTACMNQNEVEMSGKTPLVEFLNSLGNWPLLEGEFWNGDMDQAMAVLGDITRAFGQNGLFTLDVVPNMFHNREAVIFIQSSSSSLIPPGTSIFYYEPKADTKDSLREIIFDLAVAIKSDVKSNRYFVEKQIDAMLLLWYSISKAKLENTYKDKFEIISINDLTGYTKVNWHIFFDHAFLGIAPIFGYYKILVSEKQLLRGMFSLARMVDNPARTLTNLAVFIIIRPLLWHLTLEFQDLSNRINKELRIPVIDIRQTRCVTLIMDCLPYLATRIFADRFIKQEDIYTVANITETILETYREELKKNDWLTEESKKRVVEKISALKYEIGFPSSVKDDTALKYIYSPLNLSGNHFQNILDCLELMTNIKFGNLIDDPRSKLIWRASPLAVNAWYILYENLVQIFAGLLRAANVTSDSSLAKQYGVLGTVIAHEITHSLDTSGVQVDKNGNALSKVGSIEGPLLDKQSAIKFLQKLNCLVKQYEDYCYKKKCVNGVKTVNENLADNSGVRIAFKAFMKKINGKSRVKSVDNTLPKEIRNITLKQQFFFHFARVWCVKENENDILAQIQHDTHSPSKFRVIGSLSNLPEFAAEYGCNINDEMNPIKKCIVW